MSPSYLLDTNICIAYKKNKSGVPERIDALPAGQAAMSVVTWGELVLGAEKSQHRERSFAILRRVREIIPVLGIDDATGDHYGVIRGELEKKGTPIGPNDTWIAAHARATGRCLVTNNTGEFARVSGLIHEDWTA
jgi:tRNA(fMet)-specific endonuclease VapC